MAEQNSAPAVDMSAFATRADMPQPADNAPPSVADASAKGDNLRYALENHTHASKARKVRAQCTADGLLVWNFDPPFAPGVVPIVVGQAEAPANSTDVINSQLDGLATNTGCRIRVTRTQRSFLSLLGLNVLSFPAQTGVMFVDAVALEP